MPAAKANDNNRYLREDGERRPANAMRTLETNVCNYCATREARQYANYIGVFSLGNQQPSMLDAVAERESGGEGDSNPRYRF